MSGWCGDKKVMCTLCFECFTLDELYINTEGCRWDACKACQLAEAYAINERLKNLKVDDHGFPAN